MTTRGIDCSGLVHMAFRRVGRLVRATPISRRMPAPTVELPTARRPRHLRQRGRRPHRLLARRRADSPLDRPRRRDRRRRGGRAGLPARAAAQTDPAVIAWAASDGREEGGDNVVPAASTIKLFVASAFWRSDLDPGERVEVPEVPWSVADRLAGPADARRLRAPDARVLGQRCDQRAPDSPRLRRRERGGSSTRAERTEIRRLMMADGPENVTCPRDLARGLAAIDEPRILAALGVAHDSELPFRLPDCEVLVKTGEIWPRVYHEVALIDRRLSVAVCSEPAVLPGQVAAVAERVDPGLPRSGRPR